MVAAVIKRGGDKVEAGKNGGASIGVGEAAAKVAGVAGAASEIISGKRRRGSRER